MLKAISFLCLLLLSVGCVTYGDRADYIPDKEGMALLLADIYQVEASMSQGGRHINSNRDEMGGYYREVLQRHHLLKSEFDSALNWYSANPKLYAEVYEEAIAILSERDALLKQEMLKKEEEDGAKRALMPKMQELWSVAAEYSINENTPDSVDIRLPYNITIDSLKNGLIRFNASYKFLKGNLVDSAYLCMVACYADSSRDTSAFVVKKSFKALSGNITYSLPGSKVLVGVEGSLFDHDTSKVALVEINNVKMTFVPKVVEDDFR